MIHKVWFWLGALVRNPSLGRSFDFLKDSEGWSLDQLHSHQLERCKRLLEFAAEHSPYYRDLFKSVGFSAKGFSSLDELMLIPMTSKTDIIDFKANIDTTKAYVFKKLFPAETSGSTGQALTFSKDEEWDSFNRASILRGYSWYGVSPWERNGYFWGYDLAGFKAIKTKFLDYLQNRFRVFSYSEKDLLKFIRKLKNSTFLHGYSSMIYEVSRLINQKDVDASGFHLKMIKGTSEKIYDHYQGEVEKAFGGRMISEYGAAEAGIIAFECPHGNMHLNMEGCIVEEVEGEIVVTNLNSYSFPIIRYKLGDAVNLEEDGFNCPCGMSHRVLREVTGRVGKQIYGFKNTYPSLTIYNIFKNVYFNYGLSINGQVIQREKGVIIVNIDESISSEGVMSLETQLKQYFGEDLSWDIRVCDSIHLMDGKRKDFISFIDP